ncbi:helix-turn-helix domain-containing protein [Weissella soli]|jgi:repressor LexA|nr:helix-turn-helix transcriptional regulator [Weissella soli]MCT8395496.1 helix-turn-helix domain-containing protein [Weissella soli]NKY83294.1 helix-turn-helix transcriptional regulator [Weissella soli]QEA34260.1 helix-turn-helix transcriptional regulator [Weissella soli]
MASSEGKQVMGANIKRLLKQNRMTAAKLAEVVGVSTATVSDWSNGKTYPRIDKLEFIADYFGVSKAELVEDPQTISNSSSEEPVLMAAHWGLDITGLPEVERQRVVDKAKAYVEGLIADYEDHHA